MSASYPCREGNKISTFIGGYEFYTHLQNRCSNALNEIWFGVSFVYWNFKFPNGEIWWKFLINLKKKRSNLNIRVLFWRNIDKKNWSSSPLIRGNQNDLNFIQKNNINKYLELKWDESPTATHCHHQKYYVIDNKYALIGGMTLNLDNYYNFIHDTFVEINGPSVIDVINNFKLRWNHNNIYSKCETSDICQTTLINKNDFQITKLSNNININVQICWSCYPNIYPGYKNGEQSIFNKYYRIFNNAQSYIYIESQHMGEYTLLKLMKQKLETNPNFYIIYIMPKWVINNAIKKEKQKSINYAKNNNNNTKPRYYDTFQMLSSLKNYSNFCLTAIYHDHNKIANGDGGLYNKIRHLIYNQIPTYVHSKLCIVDGKWFTIGSANMVDISFLKDHTEINAFITNKIESIKLLKRLAVIHCNQQHNKNIFNDWDDKKIIKYMINCAENNKNGLSKLNPQNYGTSKECGVLYRIIMLFIWIYMGLIAIIKQPLRIISLILNLFKGKQNKND